MAEKGTQDPTTGTEKDISKAQAEQRPQTGQQGQREFAQDQEGPTDEALQGETLAEQRTDIEGSSLQSPEKGEAESGFVGAEGKQDTSGELVEDEDEDKEGFTPEGK
jgi:hypothetical protein